MTSKNKMNPIPLGVLLDTLLEDVYKKPKFYFLCCNKLHPLIYSSYLQPISWVRVLL